MRSDYTNQTNPCKDLQMNEPELSSNMPFTLPDITNNVVSEVVDCVKEAIDNAADSEITSAMAYNATTQSIIDGYLIQLDKSELSEDKKGRIYSEISDLKEKQGIKDTEIRSENTKRFKLFLDSMVKIALGIGGVYALKLTISFLKEVILSYKKS